MLGKERYSLVERPEDEVENRLVDETSKPLDYGHGSKAKKQERCGKPVLIFIIVLLILLYASYLVSTPAYEIWLASHKHVGNTTVKSFNEGEEFTGVIADVKDVDTDIVSLNDEVLNSLAVKNLQHRTLNHLGNASDGYVHINTHNNRIKRRRANVALIDQIRVKSCGEIGQEYLNGRANGILTHPSVRWYGQKDNEKVLYTYAKDSIAYKWEDQINRTFRSFCNDSHPTLPDVTVSIERQGPFYSHGNLDWNQVAQSSPDTLLLRNHIANKTVYVVGTYFALVYRNGSTIGYPPLHIHHAHIHPYSKKLKSESRVDGMPFEGLEHHVLIQTHGDGGCKPEEGGTDCNLHQLPDGQGYRVYNSDGFNINYEINDVRPNRSEPLEFFVDIVVMWTYKKKTETTFMQIGSPVAGAGWMTYIMPLDSNSNVAYWNHTNQWLGPGTISNFIMHTHMSLTDSVYVFKGQDLYAALENYRRTRMNGAFMPYLYECHDDNVSDNKKKLLGLALGAGGELVCEATRPSMDLYCDNDSGERNCIYRDTRIQFNCKESMRWEDNEELVIMAFNKVRNTSTTPITRNSPINSLQYISTFGQGYAAHQHSFFRFDFVSDKARKGEMGPSTGNGNLDFERGVYAPAALFLYSNFPFEQYLNPEHMDRPKRTKTLVSFGNFDKFDLIEDCPSHFSYSNVNLPNMFAFSRHHSTVVDQKHHG